MSICPLRTHITSPLRHQAAFRLRHTFSEWDRKGGYVKEEKLSMVNKLILGQRMIPKEIQKLRKLWREPAVWEVKHGDYKFFAKFREMKDLNDWPVTVDATHGEGHSTAEFVKNENTGTAVFRGNIRTDFVKSGDTVRAGYASIRSHFNYMFGFRRSFNFYPFTHLVIRYRGDGRHYMVNINMNRFLDIQWLDQHNFFLFTRGGPYWQTAKIPFSKFFFTHRGRIQDQQTTVDLDKVDKVTITAGGGKRAGPFHLELDYIALYYDQHHKEETAYEQYETTLTSQGYN